MFIKLLTKTLAGYNDLAATRPDIATMWHPRMNRRLDWLH